MASSSSDILKPAAAAAAPASNSPPETDTQMADHADASPIELVTHLLIALVEAGFATGVAQAHNSQAKEEADEAAQEYNETLEASTVSNHAQIVQKMDAFREEDRKRIDRLDSQMKDLAGQLDSLSARVNSGPELHHLSDPEQDLRNSQNSEVQSDTKGQLFQIETDLAKLNHEVISMREEMQKPPAPLAASPMFLDYVKRYEQNRTEDLHKLKTIADASSMTSQKLQEHESKMSSSLQAIEANITSSNANQDLLRECVFGIKQDRSKQAESVSTQLETELRSTAASHSHELNQLKLQVDSFIQLEQRNMEEAFKKIQQLETLPRTVHQNLANQVAANGHSIKALTARYNNLSSEQLAKRMAHHLNPLHNTLQVEQNGLRIRMDQLEAQHREQKSALDMINAKIRDDALRSSLDEISKQNFENRMKTKYYDVLEDKVREYRDDIRNSFESLRSGITATQEAFQQRVDELEHAALLSSFQQRTNQKPSSLSQITHWSLSEPSDSLSGTAECDSIINGLGKHHPSDQIEDSIVAKPVPPSSRKRPRYFDIVLHGSPEHIDTVRDIHAHHEGQQHQLKEEHPDVFDKFEKLRNELDVLDTEIHMLTDHSVALDASFDKFGYSAHLRTREDSETSSLHGEHSSAKRKHLDRTARPIKFFRRPQVRQYFHKGLLWRSPEAGEVASFELFLDLVYVGVIDIVGEKAVEQPDGLSLLHFVIIFSIGWKIWSDMTNVINWFDIDDIFQRLSVIFYLVCLFGYTTNVFYMFEEDEPTYTSAIAFYIAQRIFVGSWYLMFNWIYFEIDAYNVHVHAIRRHWLSSVAWMMAHLPFIMSYVLAAATLSQLVLAHDCPDANPEKLGSHYADLSVEHVSDAMRWFYCGGLGVSLICMGIISFCHIHKKLDGARLLKRPRLAIRATVSIIIICLPLAHNLTSLDLISITCSLTIFILCIDLYGNSCHGQQFWTGGLCRKERKNVTYTATCKMSSRKKKQLIKAMQKGETPGLSEFLRRDSSMSSLNGSGTSTPNVKDEEWTGGYY
ncbi:hypothetical protein DV737_g3985, partial [Chaetothyriales sp. CBS 132003]